MSLSINTEFGLLRSIFWPVHRHELKMLVPMLFMLFLICFNYTTLRNMKNSLVITSSGAAVIPFIKVWALLPMAVIITIIFTKLSNRYSQERVFYIIISFFLLSYALFAFIFYPLRDSIHPNETADVLETILPIGFKGLISMFRHWSFTGFYVICELWSTMVMSVLFWGFANEVTRVKEARRFYGVFGIASNFAAIAAGYFSKYASEMGFVSTLPYGKDAWEQTMMSLVLIIILSGLITMGLFYWMNRRVLTDPSFDELHQAKRTFKRKKKLSLRESFAYLSKSKYIGCIAILVVSYNLVINLVEVVWNDRLSALYPAAADYSAYINNLTMLMGVISTLSALFMVSIIGRFGWTRTALVTPIIMLVTSAGFFSFLFFQDNLADYMFALTGTMPLAIAVFFGSAQNCMSKAAKYSFFDTTKEMAFIPLDHESKLKGKAAIDGVGSRLGKSGGSLIHQGLLMMLGTLAASASYVAIILFGVIILWIIATRSLGRQFNALADEKTKEVDEKDAAWNPNGVITTA
jgi:ATP:ADP antiporter, AAA family